MGDEPIPTKHDKIRPENMEIMHYYRQIGRMKEDSTDGKYQVIFDRLLYGL